LSIIEAGFIVDQGIPRDDEIDPRLLRDGERRQAARRDAAFRRTMAAADLASAAGALLLIHVFAGHPLLSPSLVSIPAIVLLAKLLGRYDQDNATMRRSTLDEVPALVTLAAFWAVCWSLVVLIVGGDHLGLGSGSVGALWLLTSGLLITLRTGARLAVKAATPRERVLIVGTADTREGLARSLATDPGARIEVVGFLPLEDERRTGGDWDRPERRKRARTFADLAQAVDDARVDRVLLIPTTADSELMLDAIRYTVALGLSVSIVPRLFEVIGSAVEFDTVGGVTVLGVRRPGLSRSSRALKRATDVIGATVGLLLLSPVFLVTAIAIKLDSEGPVFFRQSRVGRGGHEFQMLKFRSMVDGAERQQEALAHHNETAGLFKIRDDPRITQVGRIVRRTSIDELPQLLNVLTGDMSLVGPRPLVVAEDRLIEGHHRERLTLAPGMTGPWQVLGPARPPLADMVKTDYLYSTNWSLWADIKILIRTIAHIGGRRGV
jgi:exopolysaccharide biosynthesis polyprenyl glycosylphosphotransferase